jgi:hypothetical protein
MIKLKAIEPSDGYRLTLHFSDGTMGVCDFASFIEADTQMTAPLRDPAFFSSCFIELGALAWPNGFDLSAASLHQKLKEKGQLKRDVEAA